MKDRERLANLLKDAGSNGGLFGVLGDGTQVGRGNIPVHYKRITIPEDARVSLANLGMYEVGSHFFDTQLFFTQALIAGVALSGKYHKIAVISPSQFGKLLADDTPVLTRCGWKNHGELVVGDEVIAPDGKFVKVTYVHPKGVANRIVTFRNGDQIMCHENHEWVVLDRGTSKIETLETKEIERRGVWESDERSRFLVQAIEPVAGEHKELAVDPYVLGVWLGDGSTTKGQITEGAKDVAVLEKVREVYPRGTSWVHKDTGVPTWSFVGLADDLHEYGMCYQGHPELTKRIPEEYLTASLEQRLQLLAGLMDTDGYSFAKDGRCYISTANADLRDDIETLVSTFGWRFSTVSNDPRVSSSGIHGRQTVYVIGFNPSFDIPCVLERKRPARYAKQRNLGIVDISPCDPIRGNCITVEGGVYCVGRHLIPTHNSFLLGTLALLLAYQGHKVNVGAATADKTDIIMSYCMQAASRALPEVKKALTAEQLKKVDRLDQSISKQRLSFPGKGSVQAFTLGDTYQEGQTAHNKAVGESGMWIIDEAALCSERSMSELGRREFSAIDGTTEPLIMISNPHNRGYFYDFVTKEDVKPGECVIWMDALTAVQEGRWTADVVLSSDFADTRDTLQRYLLCELPSEGAGMFDDVIVGDVPHTGECVSMLGVDAAYKGKDSIEVCQVMVGPEKLYVAAVETIKKPVWVDGVTSQEIIDQISRIYHRLGCAMCYVDEGWGVWLKEGLVLRGVNAKGIAFGSKPTKTRTVRGRKTATKRYAATMAKNKRDEMHLDLRDLIEHQAIVFSEQAYGRVKDVLPFISCEIKPDGKMHVTPKPEIKIKVGHSPDALDAVLLAVHAAVIYYDNYEAYITEEAM